MKLIEVKSDIKNKVELLIEHKKINSNSHHLNYVLTNINNKFYFVNASSDIVTINDNLICPYCLQQLTTNKTYKKKNGTIVQFFVKHKSKNELSEGCIFKNSSIGGYSDKVDRFYKSKEFIQKSIVSLIKEEINKGFKIAIPSGYTISSKEGISIKFKYKYKNIINIYPSPREEFICRLQTDKNETIFCMLGENEINIRNKYKNLWGNNKVTVVIFKEDKPYLNSEIEPKVSIHSKFYTTCLYSEIVDNAHEEYLIENEKYKEKQKIVTDVKSSIVNKSNDELDKYNNRKSLEIWVDHELERVKLHLENKFGLKKISSDTWMTNDGGYHKLKNIKVVKNDMYFYRQCPEIYLRYIEPIGYKLELL